MWSDVEVAARVDEFVGHRTGYQARRRHRDRAEHADRVVHAFGNEGAGADDATVLGRREQTHLGHGRRGDVPEVHQRSRGEADALDELADLAIALDREGLLVPAQSDLLGLETDDRHAVVDAGDADPFDDVHDVAGGQE